MRWVSSFFLHGAAAAVEGIQKLGGELVGHAFFTAGTGVGDQPTDGKGDLAVRTHFHGHLIGGAAHAAGLDFEMGLHVFESLFEGAQRFFAGLFGEDFKSAIEIFSAAPFLPSYMRRFTKRAAKRLP